MKNLTDLTQFSNEDLETLCELENPNLTEETIHNLNRKYTKDTLILYLYSCIQDSEHDGEDEPHLHNNLFTINTILS